MEQLKQDYNIVRQVQRFYCSFHRFPDFVKAGDVEVGRNQIIETVERYLNGKPFQWFRRSKFSGQTKDAMSRIKAQL